MIFTARIRRLTEGNIFWSVHTRGVPPSDRRGEYPIPGQYPSDEGIPQDTPSRLGPRSPILTCPGQVPGHTPSRTAQVCLLRGEWCASCVHAGRLSCADTFFVDLAVSLHGETISNSQKPYHINATLRLLWQDSGFFLNRAVLSLNSASEIFEA